MDRKEKPLRKQFNRWKISVVVCFGIIVCLMGLLFLMPTRDAKEAMKLTMVGHLTIAGAEYITFAVSNQTGRAMQYGQWTNLKGPEGWTIQERPRWTFKDGLVRPW